MFEIGTAETCEPEALRRLLNTVFRSSRPGDMMQEYPLLFTPGNRRNLHVASLGGRPCAMVGVYCTDVSLGNCTVRAALIGSVCTDPEQRGGGLATNLMERARASAIEQGASLMLISGGRGLYRRLGYVVAGAFRLWSTPSAASGGASGLITADEFTLSTIQQLHREESIRFFRTGEEWRLLVRAGMLVNHPGRLLWNPGRGAYAAFQLATPERPSTQMKVHEYAGSREFLSTLLPVEARLQGFEGVQLYASAADGRWNRAASVAGWRSDSAEFPGTVGVIDVPRFLAAVKPVLDERSGGGVSIQPSGSGCTVRVGSETTEVAGMAEVTSLLFGGTDRLSALPDSVRAGLDGVLPLALPWYGFDYI